MKAPEAQGGGVLVVGAGEASVQLAASLRDGGWAAPITLIGDEPHPPYRRPPLSKAYLSGSSKAEELHHRSPGYFSDHGIELLTGEEVTAIDRDPRGGGTALTSTGKRVPFTDLVLATGARPRTLPIPGFDGAGVHGLRTLADAARIRDALASAPPLVVVGGGFIGLELAATAVAAGSEVTVLEAAPRLLGRAVGEATSAYIAAATRKRGISVVLDAEIVGLERASDGAPQAVRLSDGTAIPAGIVGMGVGVVPRVELAESLGLDVANGIVVDAYSRCSDHQTLAIGDCANVPNPYDSGGGPDRVRLESVNHAIDQATFAARTLLGDARPYRSVPWFWSDQGSTKLQIAGLSSGHDDVVVRGDPDSERVSFLYFRGARLIAADCINHPAEFSVIRRHLGSPVYPDRSLIGDPAVKLAGLLAEAAAVDEMQR